MSEMWPEATQDAIDMFASQGYPAGYQDPEWDGSSEGFRDVVLPARVTALEESLNAAFADVLPPGVKFEWVADDE